ncbi:unnamed protein product [Polarella glacialis]|uniref:Uncharacterized protein n=1 Tax=Polarella glacialis TaxID=89957 RepID=A0A813GQB3_POLGL|nr:unnamed protein product [Polarella glacialis]
MTQRGPHPDLVSFNSVMGACGRRQQLEQVLELLRSTRRVLGVVPDEFSFTYSVAACERRQQWALALALLCEAAQAGLQWSPTGAATATNAALSACGSHGLWRVAAALLESLVSVRLSNVVTYTAAMAACASRACWTSALKLLLDMPEARLDATAAAATAAINACEAAQQSAQVPSVLGSAAYQAQNVLAWMKPAPYLTKNKTYVGQSVVYGSRLLLLHVFCIMTILDHILLLRYL